MDERQAGASDWAHLGDGGLTGEIIGAAITVHRSLGAGFIESIYESAMVIAMERRGLSFSRQVAVPVRFDDLEVGLHRLDLLVEDRVIVELKAVRRLELVHRSILRSYLAATDLSVGLLLNFRAPKLQIERITPLF